MSDFIATIFLTSCALFIGFIIGASAIQDSYQESAVAKGYAEYCSTTGEWAWKGECSK